MLTVALLLAARYCCVSSICSLFLFSSPFPFSSLSLMFKSPGAFGRGSLLLCLLGIGMERPTLQAVVYTQEKLHVSTDRSDTKNGQ